MGRKKVANLGRAALEKAIKEDSSGQLPEKTTKSSDDATNQVLYKEACPLSDAMKRMSLVTNTPSIAQPTNEPLEKDTLKHMCINFLSLQEILLRVPSNAHPAVTTYIKSQVESRLNVHQISCEDIIKLTPGIARNEIEQAIMEISSHLGFSLDVFLVPPTSTCLLVSHILYFKVTYIILQCHRQLDPMINKSTQVLIFDHGGVNVATKFRYR